MSLPVTFELSGDDLRRVSDKLIELASRIDDLDERRVPIAARIRVPGVGDDNNRLEIEVSSDEVGLHWVCKC